MATPAANGWNACDAYANSSSTGACPATALSAVLIVIAGIVLGLWILATVLSDM